MESPLLCSLRLHLANTGLCYIQNGNCAHACVCPLIAQERIRQFAPNLACLLFESRNRYQKGQKSGKDILGSSTCENAGFRGNSVFLYDNPTARIQLQTYGMLLGNEHPGRRHAT